MFPSIRAQLTAWLALLVTLCLTAFAVYLYVSVAVGQLLTANLDQALVRGDADLLKRQVAVRDAGLDAGWCAPAQ